MSSRPARLEQRAGAVWHPLFLYAVKDRKMCTRPIEQDGKTFACRSCDECIATRRHGWVARAMAEKAMNSHALVVALTYSDETEIGRQGARMFCYADVRDFLKRCRSAARYLAEKEGWNVKPSIRFLCAGEQGDRNGRCHWHMVIFTNFDLTRLGTVSGRYGVIERSEDMLTVGKRKRRLNWSLWPLGFVTFQEPDQGGMNYVLSYCLKDQFTGEKSLDTMREANAENFATGLFRMSKRPAIGEAWLYSKMAELDRKGAVLPRLELRVPGFHGYYVPSGSFREKTLWALVALNRRVVWATGAPAPQWPSLLASCRENEADLEILNGPQTDEEEDPLEVEVERRRSQAAGESARRDFARRCGAAVACDWCLGFLSEAALAQRGLERFEDEAGVWQYRSAPGRASLAERRAERGSGINPDCRERGSKLARLTFPATGGGAGSAG